MRETEDSSDQQCSLSLSLQPSPGMNNPVQFHLSHLQLRFLQTNLSGQTFRILQLRILNRQHHNHLMFPAHPVLHRYGDLPVPAKEDQQQSGLMKAKLQNTSDRTFGHYSPSSSGHSKRRSETFLSKEGRCCTFTHKFTHTNYRPLGNFYAVFS